MSTAEDIRTDLSIVIPVYNEMNKIIGDIETVLQFFSSNNINGEVVIVNDGSKDGTNETILPFVKKHPAIVRLESYFPNKGKGFAVKTGIMKTKGKLVMFADSGLCIPYHEVLEGAEMIKNNVVDIVHGSRFLKESRIVVPQKWHRSVLSLLFRSFIRFYSGIPKTLTDTQCGFKIYHGDIARELYNRCQINGFMFDIEVILNAVKMGYRIKEIPVTWTNDRDSRLQLSKNLFKIFHEIHRIKHL